MRCACRVCGTYMIQADDSALGCKCPHCGERCTDCLGTDSVMSREAVAQLRSEPLLAELLVKGAFADEDDDEP